MMKTEPQTKPWVFITGMFRSGTTLLGIICHNHPKLRLAQDPYAPLFRAFRNEVESRLRPGEAFDAERPIDDYYYFPEKLALMNAVQAARLDLAIGHERAAWLVKNLNASMAKFAPELAPFASREIEGTSYRDLFGLAVERIGNASLARQDALAGFKQAWMGEFVPHITDSFPQARVIFVTRDPRAVCASKQSRDAKYPWLFMIRHWRKHAVFAWKTAGARVMPVKYEDLVSQPEKTAKKICSFLGVEFDPRMIDAPNFVDGSGKPWAANSAHETQMRHLNPAMISAWRSKLTKQQIAFIETLCLPEMAVMDYAPEEVVDRESLISALMDFPSVAPSDLAEWIRPYAPPYENFPGNQIGLEYLRLDAAQNPASVPSRMKQALFLDEGFFDAASQKMSTSAPLYRAIQETTA